MLKEISGNEKAALGIHIKIPKYLIRGKGDRGEPLIHENRR
jgi:hypothetical protein